MKKSLMIMMLLGAVALYGQQIVQSAQPPQQQQQQTGAQSQQGAKPVQPTQPGQQPQQQPGQMQQAQPGQMQQAQPGQTQPSQPGQAQQPGAMQQPGQPGAQAAGAQCPQGEAVPQVPSGPAPPAPKAPEIKDQAEYNAYVAAVQAANPQAKASGLEGFLNTYPNSAAKRDALNTLMFLYSQTGNAERLQATAQKAAEADANNAIAWYFLAVLLRGNIESGKVPPEQVPQIAEQLAQTAQKGLQALPNQPKLSDQMTDAQFQQLRDSFYQEFVRGIGFAALQTKDYCKAQQYLTAVASKQSPQDPQAFATAYQLATAYLEQNPPNPFGFWWAARAVNLAPAQSKGDIQKYATYKYTKFHGDSDGWNEILTSAASATAPPAGFTVPPAPTPPEQAAKMVASKPVDQMSLDEIQFVLTSGNQQAADQVWTAIKDKPIAAEGAFVGPGDNPDTIQLAGLYDNINAKPPKADINMTLAVKPGKLPQSGATVDFQGNPVSYTPNPFMITMDKGCLIDMKTRKCMTATAAPARPTHRPGTTTHSTTRKPPGQ
ncbi:MAG TPA: hypothetical protein VKB56_04570 [Terriglobales bacterium]|nr:hypothetical protein [Terriglobales bacterium]